MLPMLSIQSTSNADVMPPLLSRSGASVGVRVRVSAGVQFGSTLKWRAAALLPQRFVPGMGNWNLTSELVPGHTTQTGSTKAKNSKKKKKTKTKYKCDKYNA